MKGSSLDFSSIADLLNHYGVKMSVSGPAFVRKIDTTIITTPPSDGSDGSQQAAASSTPVANAPELEKTGIPATLNLRYFLSILMWALQVSTYILLLIRPM